MLLWCLIQEITSQNKMCYYSHSIVRQIMLPSAYWLLNLFKHVSKYNTATLRQKSYLPHSFKDV
jgi:hypothetical protein